MLTRDARFEGWTTEAWIRFLRLWQPRGERETTPSGGGGIVVVHEGGQILKLLHTHQGRLDPASALPPPSQGDARALALRTGQSFALAQIARDYSIGSAETRNLPGR